MSRRKFFGTVGILLLILVAVNIAVAIATRNSVPRRVMARARQFPRATVMGLGNSLMGAGFIEAPFNRAMGLEPSTGAVNLALGASSPVEQLLLLRYALRTQIHPQLLLYGFYDFQLTDPLSMTTADLVGNRAVLYYLEPEYGRAFYQLSMHDRAEFEIMRRFPMTVDRGAIWAKVELLRREISQQGMPEEVSNRFGRARDFSLLEASDPAEFIGQCKFSMNRSLVPAVQEIIRHGKAAGAKIVIIEMPMPPSHLQLFYDTAAWERYSAHVREQLGQAGVTYLDASRWFGDASSFADSLHLTEVSGLKFSERLGELLRGFNLIAAPQEIPAEIAKPK